MSEPARPPLGSRLLWFIGLWLLGVGAVTGLWLVLRLVRWSVTSEPG